MYLLIIVILLAIAAALVLTGLPERRFARVFGGVFVGVSTVFFFWFMGFWGEMLWFKSLGYTHRFLLVFFYRAGFAFAGAVAGWLAVSFLTHGLSAHRKFARIISRTVGALIGLVWGLGSWDVLLKFMNKVSTDMKEPILGRDTGFYLFTLPFYDALFFLLVLLTLVSLGTLFLATMVRVRGDSIDLDQPRIPEDNEESYRKALFRSAAAFVLVLAWGKYLNRFHLMYSEGGAVTGAGWTDVHILMPAYVLTALLTGAAGAALLVPSLRNRLASIPGLSRVGGAAGGPFKPLVTAGAGIAILWFVALSVIPGLFQWLRVEPNEITFERPYIGHNIEFTRRGFSLHDIQEREFPASEKFTRQMVEGNRNLFDNIRLWDPRALDAVYKQFQEIRLYYEFADVDIDRYHINGDYRQVMVSARELKPENLPPDSRTFVNRRFKYTHGYGITMTNVSEFTPEGLPDLLIRDIPPRARYESLEVERPQIYYGELTNTHVVANSKEKELDYPKGEENVYVRYQGKGGVQISNIFRKFLYGWKFDGTRFFLSGYPTPESRILFHREIKERLRTVAPFLSYDNDPYIVMSEGRLYWIVDCYTTSGQYPYSEPFSSGVGSNIGAAESRRLSRALRPQEAGLGRINYIRNSVKAVVDAFNGSVDLYIFEQDDPLIRVWDKIFPGLFKDRDRMPEPLFKHIRYPADMLEIQGLVYSKYHMTDPTVFYNQEDLWVRATEKYYGSVQPVEPYYIMWEPPGSDKAEFILILPFTPKNRQVLIGWIAGMCDPGSYGRLLSYKFPKEKRILGTQQVETKIDQDRFLSGQLTLWDQRGSNVIRGNVLVIPIQKTLLYVEPIYLRAETAAYPELRLVVLMHGDNLSYGETFEEALDGLLEGQPPMKDLEAEKAPGAAAPGLDSLIGQAGKAFDDYLNLLAEKRFREAAGALEDLQGALDGLMEVRPGKPDAETEAAETGQTR